MTIPKGSAQEGPPKDLLLQYLVVLAGTDPLVWRRLLVPATYSFWDLHVAIQDAMGWMDCHLHQFNVVDPRSGTVMSLGIPDPGEIDDPSIIPDWTHFPFDFCSGTVPAIQYSYDFGDDWEHSIIWEGFDNVRAGGARPRCLAGAGACPPENCGGPGGYANLLEALRDADHPQHQELSEWLGRPLDPSDFSVEDVRFDDPERRWRTLYEEGAI